MDSNFKDRPDTERLTMIKRQYAEVDITAVQTFLDLQFTYRVVQSHYETVLGKHDLSESRFILLMFLSHAEAGLSVSDLATKLGATKATTSKLLHAMTAANLVERVEGVKDKRTVLIHMTALGRQHLATFLPINFQTVNDLLGRLSNSEQQQLDHLLRKIVSNNDNEEK